MTKRTGMSAIESLIDGLAQRRVLRVFNHHRSPCDRLKRDPMQTNRAAERENRHDAADTANHAHETSEPADQCQSTRWFVLVFLISLEQKRHCLRRDKLSIQCARFGEF